jgi:hypothetical protein
MVVSTDFWDNLWTVYICSKLQQFTLLAFKEITLPAFRPGYKNLLPFF